ncbi:hypothetical protein LHYA1_G002560 [Lachnellula hyalina]|uniref:Acetyltransferase n=1 Tax=Lachnellula hyalina TaxID=1316788 RepID=A0A8H8U1I2_9HELO|nr:uncharacterized protein LHYA1_G002560 [Lachnellula hyalina]TVY30074.1 hypothetical protein LHYA1_G002560 [Lachnellula hyalina]
MLGRLLLSLSGISQILGPFIADFNETHVKNPNWPPHARFHNGQTMSMGLGLGLATLYFTHRHGYAFSSPSVGVAREKDSLMTAAVFGSLYWLTGLSAILYPGSLAVDPEFGEGFPQFWLFLGLAAASWGGWGLEIIRLNGGLKKRS